MIIIREATLKDAEEIRNIALSRVISSDSEERSGLIDYPVPRTSKYFERISKGRIYVADDTSLGKLVGFMDSFPNEILREVFVEDPVVNHIMDLEEKPFVYSNTLALLINYEGKGISSRLLRKVVDSIDRKYSSIWGVIVHKPKANKGSIKFSERKGFKFQQEFAMSNGLTLGLYKKLLD